MKYQKPTNPSRTQTIIKPLLAAVIFFAINLAATASSLTSVPLNNPAIFFKGAHYTQYGETSSPESGRTGPQFVQPLRFSKAVLQMPIQLLRFSPTIARWAAGIEMHLATNSQNIVITLDTLPTKRGRERFGIGQVYKDGNLLKDYRLKSAKKTVTTKIHLQSPDRKNHHYRIMLPATMAVRITRLEIDKGSKLSKVQLPSKPVYIAMGDSITHGSAGLDGISTYSYPYLLASNLGYDLYNLGIGAGRVSPRLGTMLKDWEEIGFITLLIGYNDLSWAGIPKINYRNFYSELLQNIRRSHPDTPLFCITLTFTTLKKSPKSGVTPEEYREIVRVLVKKFQDQGDKNIHLIEGETLNDITDLHDPVHLNIKGNQKVARKLGKMIQTQLNPPQSPPKFLPTRTLRN